MIRHLLLFVLSVVCFLPIAHAGRVVKVSGKKVYIIFDSNEGGTFAENDFFLLTDGSGKKKALIQLKKVKGLKAVALLKKGKADKGYGTVFKSAGSGKGELSDDGGESKSSGSSSHYNRNQSHWGAMFGYGVAGQDVNQGTSTSTESGSSMGIKLGYDYPLLPSVTLRGLGGVELFSVSGQGMPLSSTAQSTVGTDITYISFDGLAKWNFAGSLYGFAGAGILYPMTKSSDVIVEGSIESLAVGEFGVGYEIGWGHWIVPIDFTYYFFPAGSDVKTSLYSIKLGIFF